MYMYLYSYHRHYSLLYTLSFWHIKSEYHVTCWWIIAVCIKCWLIPLVPALPRLLRANEFHRMRSSALCRYKMSYWNCDLNWKNVILSRDSKSLGQSWRSWQEYYVQAFMFVMCMECVTAFLPVFRLFDSNSKLIEQYVMRLIFDQKCYSTSMEIEWSALNIYHMKL